MDTNCKIGKITFKDSKLAVFRSSTSRDNDVCKNLVEAARTCNQAFEGNLQGFILIGWTDGGNSTVTRFEITGFPAMMAPEFAKTVILRGVLEGEP